MVKNDFGLNRIKLKILLTILEINILGYYPSTKCIYSLLKGEYEGSEFDEVSTLGSYRSIGKKACGIYINQLKRFLLLEEIYDSRFDERYFTLTNKGEEVANEFKKSFKPTPCPKIIKKPLFIKRK